MFRPSAVLSSGIFLLLAPLSFAQPAKQGSAAAPDAAAAAKGTRLAESGHCAEALPLLKKSIRHIADEDARKRAGLDGLHCAMTGKNSYDSIEFLQVLVRDFPRDPEVLYAATHAFSDLSLRASQGLIHEAPFSYQVHMLNAESLETQGKWPEAAAEYGKIIDINPRLPGIHARVGRALLSTPQPTPEAVAQAKKSFEDELEIDPRNALAEYVLGELSKDADDLSAAIRHYLRATQIDSGFAEAYLGLGAAQVALTNFSDAIPPLETYEKLAPDSPTGHYQLALAYAGVGRKEDANREAALQREAAKSLEQIKRNVVEGLERQTGQGTQKPPQ